MKECPKNNSELEKVTVVVAVFNEEDYIGRCVKAILAQTYNPFELIIIDDCSSDKTPKIIGSINDPRIICLRNSQRMGIAYSRNVGVRKASSAYIFFTDADCMPTRHWLGEGVKVFKEKECVGVEGKTCYETARTSITDKIIENIRGGTYITCNIAYKRKLFEEAGYFNEDYKLASEDTDFARRALIKGRIEFAPDMLVFHQRKKQTIKNFFQNSIRVFSKIKYIKDTRDYRACWWRVMYPSHLIFILFPPVLVLRYRFATIKELFMLPAIYLSYVFERFLIWIAAIRVRIFII